MAALQPGPDEADYDERCTQYQADAPHSSKAIVANVALS